MAILCSLQNQAKGGIAIRTKQHFSPPDFKYSEYILCIMSQFLGICWHHCDCMTACADMFLLTFTHSEVFDVVQLHDSGTTPFKNQSRVASTTVLSINLTYLI